MRSTSKLPLGTPMSIRSREENFGMQRHHHTAISFHDVRSHDPGLPRYGKSRVNCGNSNPITTLDTRRTIIGKIKSNRTYQCRTFQLVHHPKRGEQRRDARVGRTHPTFSIPGIEFLKQSRFIHHPYSPNDDLAKRIYQKQCQNRRTSRS